MQLQRRGLLSLAVMVIFCGCSVSKDSGSAPAPANTGSAGTAGTASTPTGSSGRPTVGYVTNGIASFWLIAEAGARHAAKEYGVDVEVRMPPSDGRIANQKRMIEELLTLGVSGIAVSPIDPANQKDILNAIGDQCNFITHDSDAPETNRLAYIGMDNYDAGRMCGQLVKEALPEGGDIVLFIGTLDQLNAKLRRQGLIDELLDRSHDNTRYDAPGQEIRGDKYNVLDTRTDNFDFGAAKALVEDELAKRPDLDCMVGLFAYNPPYMLEALKSADKLGKIKLVGFDEDDATLQAIVDGYCYGTIVQNPYRYGYESVKLLAALAKGGKTALPTEKFMNIEARKITKENVEPFWAELKKLTADK